MKYRATLSLDGKIKKFSVEEPATLAVFSREGGDNTMSPFAEARLRSWFEACMDACKSAPDGWKLNTIKSHMVEHHIYLQIEEPGYGIPDFELDKETGEMKLVSKAGKMASFLVKIGEAK